MSRRFWGSRGWGAFLWVALVLCLAWASTPWWRLTGSLPLSIAWILPTFQAVFFLGIVGAVVIAALLVWRGTSRRSTGRRVGLSTLAVLTVVAVASPVLVDAVGGADASDTADTRADSDSSLRLMFLNTYFGAAEHSGIVDAVAELRPDVLILAETSTEDVREIEEATGLQAMSPVLRRTPGAGTTILVDTSDDADGVKASEVTEDAGHTRHQMPVATVDPAESPTGPVTIAGVHTNTPVHRDLVGGWLQEMADLRDWSTSQSPGDPVILAGDFNATMSHPEFRDVVSGAGSGAGSERCEDPALGPPTWPAKFPVARLDHILVRDASCGDSGTLRVDGSDHRAVWADIDLG